MKGGVKLGLTEIFVRFEFPFRFGVIMEVYLI
jgi:hypothetical protein